MESPLKVRIYTNPWDTTTNIALLVQKSGQWMIAKPVTFEFTPVKEGEQNPATMSFAPELATEFLNAMSKALDDRGIKPDSVAKVEGRLEATRHHLEDIRSLLAWFTQQGDGE